jgi:hypothetical protein
LLSFSGLAVGTAPAGFTLCDPSLSPYPVQGTLADVAAALNSTSFVLLFCNDPTTGLCYWDLGFWFSYTSDKTYHLCPTASGVVFLGANYCQLYLSATITNTGGVWKLHLSCEFTLTLSDGFTSTNHETTINFVATLPSKPDCHSFSELSLSFDSQAGSYGSPVPYAPEPVMIDGSGASATITCTA